MAVNVAQVPAKAKEMCDDVLLAQIEKLDDSLSSHFSKAMIIDKNLTRKIVSFQANKTRAHYRWYKYKEAFSADLVEYLFHKYKVTKGKILDPFAGVGTTLFASSSLGYNSDGIEVLPVGQKIIEANILVRGLRKHDIITGLERCLLRKSWNTKGETKDFKILRITAGSYPKDTHHKIKRYLNEIAHEEPELKEILLFALLCILESVSYTRKDGQYLRWDYRSGRRNGKNTFNKGKVLSFDEAISSKLKELKEDMSIGGNKTNLFSLTQNEIQPGDISVLKGSCLNILPSLKARTYTGIMTSPPYCNRYDYTRTYALEHALLGVTENELVALRQAMLSCTVENKAKELSSFHNKWQVALDVCNNLRLLQKILDYLNYKKDKKELNNNGIARMVKGYFYEMACVIQECYRLLKKNGLMFMVNDNVKYAGVNISVDTILSKIAEDLGFRIKNILVLPQSKGNSSQQMGKHGREALRKCIYIWQKAD